MLSVSSDSQMEPLINIGTDFKMEQSTDGSFTLSFTSFPNANNPGYELLKSEALINVGDIDFRVKQFSNTNDSKTVTAINTFFDHAKTRQQAIFSGNHTLINHANFALQGTGWTCTVESDIASVANYIDKFGDDNVVSLVTKICKYHQCEYMILPNRVLHFAKLIGGDYDYQFRYKHNVSSVVLKEDTSNLFTVIKGYGADGLEVIYRSPNADIFGEWEAEPIHDNRFTNAQSLKDYIASKIQDVPELAIESAIPELTSREIGERVWLIYEPLGIEMQTRILKQNKVFRNGKLITASVVFGNSLIKSTEDLFVKQQIDLEETKEELEEEIEETQKEFQSKIDQTDDRITLEVEHLNTSIAAIEIKADNINLSVNNRITNEMASINIRADQIQQTVSAQGSSISGIDSRLSSAETSITQNAYSISLKVNATDFTGANMVSMINLDPWAATIEASKINLNGAVIASGSITGYSTLNIATDATVGNNLYLGQGNGDKSLVFNNSNRINSSGYAMEISAQALALSSTDITIGNYGGITDFNGTVDFSYATVRGVALAHSPGIGISVSGSYLYVKENGLTVGSVKLT